MKMMKKVIIICIIAGLAVSCATIRYSFNEDLKDLRQKWNHWIGDYFFCFPDDLKLSCLDGELMRFGKLYNSFLENCPGKPDNLLRCRRIQKRMKYIVSRGNQGLSDIGRLIDGHSATQICYESFTGKFFKKHYAEKVNITGESKLSKSRVQVSCHVLKEAYDKVMKTVQKRILEVNDHMHKISEKYIFMKHRKKRDILYARCVREYMNRQGEQVVRVLPAESRKKYLMHYKRYRQLMRQLKVENDARGSLEESNSLLGECLHHSCKGRIIAVRGKYSHGTKEGHTIFNTGDFGMIPATRLSYHLDDKKRAFFLGKVKGKLKVMEPGNRYRSYLVVEGYSLVDGYFYFPYKEPGSLAWTKLMKEKCGKP